MRLLLPQAFGAPGMMPVECVVAVGDDAGDSVAHKAGGLREWVARNRPMAGDTSRAATVWSFVPPALRG